MVKIGKWDYIKVLRNSALGHNMTEEQDLDNQIENLVLDDAEVRKKALRQIRRILTKRSYRGEEIPDISEPLTRALKDPDNEVRRYAASTMQYLEIELVEEALKEALHDDEYTVRVSAAESLGPLAIDALIETVEDEDEDMRSSSVYSLSAIGRMHCDIRVVEPLSSALSDETTASSAASGLKDFLMYCEEGTAEPDILEILISNSENGTGETVEACYYEMGEINCEKLQNNQRLQNHMINGLEHNNDFVRRVCCGFFMTNRVNEAEDKLILILSNEQNSNVKYNAIQALGLMSSEEAVPKLLDNLNDDFSFNHGFGVTEIEVTMQIGSFIALARIGSEDYLDQLIDVYENLENKEKVLVISALAMYRNQQVMSLFREEIGLSNREIHGSIIHRMLGKGSSVMLEAIDALCSSNEIEHLSLIVDCASDHEESEIRRKCIRNLISDEATEVFVRQGLMSEHYEVTIKFLNCLHRYLLNTDCITDTDRMYYTLGGFGATLQFDVLNRLFAPYYRSSWMDDYDEQWGIIPPEHMSGGSSDEFPMDELIAYWEDADYSSSNESQ